MDDRKTTRANILARIKALQAKTVERGCTEQEAMAAAEKVAYLLDEYNIDISETEIEETELLLRAVNIRRKGKRTGKVRHASRFCIGAISALTDCRAFYDVPTGEANFYGLRPDVEFAEWLMQVVRAAIDRETAQFLGRTMMEDIAGTTYTSTEVLVESFQSGMVARINQRLNEMKSARPNNKLSDGRSLVVVKDALVRDGFEKYKAVHGIHLGVTRGYMDSGNNTAYGYGQAAGNNVGFGRPVSGGALRIGRSR